MKRCPSCMKIVEDDLDKCPSCGNVIAASQEYTFFLPPGTILNTRYYIGRVLGAGGFGITYIAHDLLLDRTVAVKEYFPNGLATRSINGTTVQTYSGDYGDQFRTGLDRFISEARRLAEFGKTPGIVQIYDCIYANGTGYIIMEYLNGSTVRELVRKNGSCSFVESCRIIMPVLDALKTVHTHGIIHRDVAPDNIFITQDGKIFLIDFGASHYSDSEDEATISIILKHGYAPEEQYRSHTHLGPWTDLYALSATQYFMVTGKKPASANNRLVKDELVPPSCYNPSIAPDEEAALLKGMAVKADERYQCADEMRTALSNCLSAGKSKASRPEYPKKKPSGIPPSPPKRRIPIVFFIIPVLLLAAAGAFFFLKKQDLLPQTETEISCIVSHVHADGSVSQDIRSLKEEDEVTILPSPEEGEAYAAVSVLTGHPAVAAEEEAGTVSVTASSLYPSIRLKYYYQSLSQNPDHTAEPLWLGIVADASGSMGFPFGSLEPIVVSDFPVNQVLEPEQISKILDSSLTDNSSLSYNGFRYYVKTQEERDEYVPLAYWDGKTGSSVFIEGQKTIPALSADDTVIGVLDSDASASPGWYFTNSVSLSATSTLSTSKLLAGENPVELIVDETGHLCCHYYWRSTAQERSSYVYLRREDNPVRTEVLQDLEASIVLEAEKQFEAPMFSVVRFNNNSLESDELITLDWTSSTVKATDAFNLSYSDGTTAGEMQEDGTYLYNYSLQGGTSTRTGLLAFTLKMAPLTNSAERRVILIIGDGADTDALGTEEDSYGYSAMDYSETLKSQGYTIASILIRSNTGVDPDAEAVLSAMASTGTDGEPLYFRLEDPDHSSVAALAEEFVRSIRE